ncbi:MAG: hypothetical protein MJ252_10355 [archaeon]|nr:hypothetical protein [archaeon]
MENLIKEFCFEKKKEINIKAPFKRVAKLADGSLAIGFSDASIRIYNKDNYQEEKVLKFSKEEKKVKSIGQLSDGKIIGFVKGEKLKAWEDSTMKFEEIPLNIDGKGTILSGDKIIYKIGGYFDSKKLQIYSLKSPYNLLFEKDYQGYQFVKYFEVKSKNLLFVLLDHSTTKGGLLIDIYSLDDFSLKGQIIAPEIKGIWHRARSYEALHLELEDGNVLMIGYSYFLIINTDKFIIEKKVKHDIEGFHLGSIYNVIIKDGSVPFMEVETEKEEDMDSTIDPESNLMKFGFFNPNTLEIRHTDVVFEESTFHIAIAFDPHHVILTNPMDPDSNPCFYEC